MRQVSIRSLRFVFTVAFALALHCAVLAQSSPVAYQVTASASFLKEREVTRTHSATMNTE